MLPVSNKLPDHCTHFFLELGSWIIIGREGKGGRVEGGRGGGEGGRAGVLWNQGRYLSKLMVFTMSVFKIFLFCFVCVCVCVCMTHKKFCLVLHSCINM